MIAIDSKIINGTSLAASFNSDPINVSKVKELDVQLAADAGDAAGVFYFATRNRTTEDFVRQSVPTVAKVAASALAAKVPVDVNAALQMRIEYVRSAGGTAQTVDGFALGMSNR